MRWLPLSLVVVGLVGVAPHAVPAAPPNSPAADAPDRVIRDDLEADENGDEVPDGWYNLRDARRLARGGVVGAHLLRLEVDKPGRVARASRSYDLDGRETEALIVGLWVRLDRILPGEREGQEPSVGLMFFDAGLTNLGQRKLGPWSAATGTGWMHMTRRVAVPPEAREVIIDAMLGGATGVMDVDGLTVEQVPRGGVETTNLVVNGDLELGDPSPLGWFLQRGPHRVSPSLGRGDSVLEITQAGLAQVGVGVRVGRFPALEVSVKAWAKGLRNDAVRTQVFFLDDRGRGLPGFPSGVLPFPPFSGSFNWTNQRGVIEVPPGADRAVIQFRKVDGNGTVRIDDVVVQASPNPDQGVWTPFHAETDTTAWVPVNPSPTIASGSALDASFLLSPPAGSKGVVTVKEGRFAFRRGSRARFFGVTLQPPSAFLDPEQADALADRLARSGVNLVRLNGLDYPEGPGLSLIDDSRDDTAELDPVALAKLDHLVAALKQRGIYVALELQGGRVYREGDKVSGYRQLPPGGGPAAAFDPALRRKALDLAKKLLAHVNPDTGLALRDDPALAFVTLAGELSVFDLLDPAEGRSSAESRVLKELLARNNALNRAKAYQEIEGSQWGSMAHALHSWGVKVPIAGSSHWRREPREFVEAQLADGLDFIDDRLYWNWLPWEPPGRRSPLWFLDGGWSEQALHKRRPDRPYVVGQWADFTNGAWALPYEAADTLLAAQLAWSQDWDALVRRGVFFFPAVWGASATGTGGGDDVFAVPESINGIPQVFALLPHAASLYLRGPSGQRTRAAVAPGWNFQRGSLLIDTPHTQGVAGWWREQEARFGDSLVVQTDNTYAVVVATSMGPEPIAQSRRLLVTAIARVEPTGFKWVDEWKRDVADPGIAPLIQEPVSFRVAWRRSGKVQAFALDNTGARIEPVKLRKDRESGFVELDVDGGQPVLHWELVVE